MDNYSLSDIAAASGDGLGGSSAFVLILLFAMIFGGNGFGFGNRSDFAQYATASSQQEILFGQQFQNLGSMINKVGDGLSSLGYSQLQQMDANTNSINGNIVNEGRNIQQQLCAINSNIDNKFAALEKSQLEQRIAEQSAQISQLQLNQAMCGVVKYPNALTYNAGGSPFCGCNSGCGY